ncbi:MAG: type II toxin-antitoxin system RelE/ParE family toxin [Lysobacteraceae bacterium]|uniref:type II toxin-antitoxin system RelE/ParE family toxin n=1 Tax=Denitratimonas sp. CY0512 TaxID=3131940 RepID=UPI0016ABF1D7|nr:type II toxin-antitoxin system RelE/ParE family toxin [Gammaproteobacteria bacterium]
MKVRLTQEAEADLEAIADWIARDNPGRAVSFMQELRACCLALGDAPLAFPLVPRYADMGVRRRVHGHHLVFYRVEAGQVVVLHILHGARDYLPLLFPREP